MGNDLFLDGPKLKGHLRREERDKKGYVFLEILFPDLKKMGNINRIIEKEQVK